jgi:hypothetical protein
MRGWAMQANERAGEVRGNERGQVDGAGPMLPTRLSLEYIATREFPSAATARPAGRHDPGAPVRSTLSLA